MYQTLRVADRQQKKGHCVESGTSLYKCQWFLISAQVEAHGCGPTWCHRNDGHVFERDGLYSIWAAKSMW
jgi:hypothetical protein